MSNSPDQNLSDIKCRYIDFNQTWHKSIDGVQANEFLALKDQRPVLPSEYWKHLLKFLIQYVT